MPVMSLPITMERSGDDRLIIVMLVWIVSSVLKSCTSKRQLRGIEIPKAVGGQTRPSSGYLVKVRVPLEKSDEKVRNSDVSCVTISYPRDLTKGEFYKLCLDFGTKLMRPLNMAGHFEQPTEKPVVSYSTISNARVDLDIIRKSIRPRDVLQHLCMMAGSFMKTLLPPTSELEDDCRITEAKDPSEDSGACSMISELQKDYEKPTVLDLTHLWTSFKGKAQEDRFTNWPITSVMGEPVENIHQRPLADADWPSNVVSTAPMENCTECLIEKPLESLNKRSIRKYLPIEPVRNRVENWLSTFQSISFDDNGVNILRMAIEEEQSESEFEDRQIVDAGGELLEDCDGNYSFKPLKHFIASSPTRFAEDEPLTDWIESSPVENGFEFSPSRSGDLAKDLSKIDPLEQWQERRSSVLNASFCSEGEHSPDWSRFPELACGGWSTDYKMDFCATKTVRTTSESSAEPPDSGFGSSPKKSRSETEEYPKEKKCSSCATVVEKSKFFNRRRYGLLMNCDHVFCYPCIGKYCKSSSKPFIKSAVCPVCEVESQVVAASCVWKEGCEKEKFFQEFLEEMKFDGKLTDIIAAKNFESPTESYKTRAIRQLFTNFAIAV